MRISTETWFIEKAIGYKAAVESVCKAGFEAVDYSLIDKDFPIYGSERATIIKELRAVTDSYGISFNQSHAPYPFKKFDKDSSSYNELALKRILDAIEIAAGLSCERIVIHPVCYSFTDQKENIERNLYDMRPLVERAKNVGIKIAIENMFGRNPEDRSKIIKNVCSTGDDHIAMIKAFKREYGENSVCAILDLGHSGLVGSRADEAILKLGKDLEALHIHDNDFVKDMHTIPFLGQIDFDAITTSLAKVGYCHDLTFEANGYMNRLPKDLIMPTLKYLKSIGEYLRGEINKKR